MKQLKRAKLAPALREAVKQHQKKLQLLINPRINMSKRRALLTQRGKGWGSIMSYLPLAAGILGTTAVKAWPYGNQLLNHIKNHAS